MQSGFDEDDEGVFATGSLSVVLPTLTAPTESSDVVTLDVRTDGIVTPEREARFEQPVFPFTDDAPPDSRPWTAVAPGQVDVRVHNHTGSGLVCSIDGSRDEIRPGAGGAATLHAELAADGHQRRGFYVVTCDGKATTHQFDLWMTSR